MTNQTPLTILIVDDSVEDRTVYRAFLKSEPTSAYVFAEAATGEDGLHLCQAARPDCLVLDFHLPDMNGLEFLDALALHPALLERCLILPGNHDVNIVDRANPARLELPTSPGKRLRQMRALGLSTEGLVQSLPRISNTEMGRELFSKVLADVPDVTAVFTCNDDLALGTLFECQQRGLRVPEDIAIVGFNDLDFCVASVPPLSSVSTGRQQMGTWAAGSILEIIRGSGERPEPRRHRPHGLRRGATAASAAPRRRRGRVW